VLRILVIDDDPAVLGLVTAMLKGENVAVHCATDGAMGLRLARELLPDMVLCDIVMPEPNGFAVLGALRREGATSAIPVIFITGVPHALQKRKGDALSADDYLLKPFSRSTLMALIEKRLTRLSYVRREAHHRVDLFRSHIGPSIPTEIVAPLSSVLGLSAFLREEGAALPGELVCEVANEILASSQRLQATVKRYLLYAELEALVHTPERAEGIERLQTEDAGAIVTDAVSVVAKARGRTEDLRLDAARIALRISPEHLKCLSEELAVNAFKFSKTGTSVVVRLAKDGDTLLLTVADAGAGILPERLAEIKEPPAESPKGQDGMPLGLAIVQRIASVYRGSVEIRSDATGTTVEVRLPVAG
jgi:two-component system, sensor histidine kinase and response regulator